MTASYTWQDLRTELENLYSDLDRIQTRMYTDCMKTKSAMKDIESIIKQVDAEIKKEEK